MAFLKYPPLPHLLNPKQLEDFLLQPKVFVADRQLFFVVFLQ